MTVVGALRRNDPERTRFCILLRDERSDADLAQALEQNPFVTDITLDLDGVQRSDWTSLLRVIATRANLETVKLQGSVWRAERSARAALVKSILQAIQQNTAIRSVDMRWLRLSTDISTFVDNASSITSFSLYRCDMEPTERELGASSLAAALQHNTNIETLELSRLDDFYAIPILESLRINTSVKTFIWKGYVWDDVWTDETGPALQRLLESTTSIQRFELIALQFSSDTFRPIAHAITRSESVSELKFEECQFQERNSSAPLQSILQNKHNLTTLCLYDCHFGAGQVHRDSIISILSRPDSPLRCFEFQSRGSLALIGGFPGIHFKNLLRAIEKSKLERFRIGCIGNQQQLQTLTQSIPSMKLKELEVSFRGVEEEGEFGPETIRHDLLQAVRNNFSLRSVEAFTAFWTAEDKQRLAFYANRNESLDQWVNHPETVKRKVWPKALSLAERAGPGALFRGLRSVLGRDYVSFPRGRKRKRVQN